MTVGQTGFLHCRVERLGDKDVSILHTNQNQESIKSQFNPLPQQNCHPNSPVKVKRKLLKANLKFYYGRLTDKASPLIFTCLYFSISKKFYVC